MKNRVEYGDDGRLDEVVTDAGMHLEDLGDGNLFLCGHRSDGSSIALHLTGRVVLVEERPAPEVMAERAEMMFGRIRAVVFPDGDVVLTRQGSLTGGATRTSRMWCEEQIEAALISARMRRGPDAICEVRAIEWARKRLRAMRQGG